MPITLSAVPQLAGNPSLSLTFSGVTGDRVTVSRLWAGTSAVLRGAKDIPTSGSVLVATDWEAPFGVPVTYSVECRSNAGAIVDQWQSTPVTLPVSRSVISDPVAPGIFSEVRLSGTSLSSISKPLPSEVLQVIGSDLPIGVVGTRQAGSMPLAFWTRTDAELSSVLNVLTSAGVVLLRCPPGVNLLPPLAYFVAPNLELVDINRHAAGTEMRTELAVTLVRPPGAKVVVPVRTYANLMEEASSYADLRTKYLSTGYAGVLRGF